MYLKTPLDWFEYMKIPTNCISTWQHNQPLFTSRKRPQWLCLHGDLQRNVWAAAGWYPGQQLLKEWLAHHGYFEQPHTPGLWTHVICPVWFNLCVVDFGIKYIGCKHLQHLYNALRKETYEILEDCTSNLYCGNTLKLKWKKHHVDLAMPAYVMKQLTKYSHVAPL